MAIVTYPQHVYTLVYTRNQKSPAIAMITGLSFCSLRSEADSNRCSSFCRAEPSHSAIGPSNPIYVKQDSKYTKTTGGGYIPRRRNVLSWHGTS